MTTGGRFTWGGCVLVAALVMAGANPADAGADCGPGHGDARIRKAGKAYVGKGDFVCDDSEGQTLNKQIGQGDKAVFEVRVENDSGARADMRLTGPVPDFDEFTIRFLRPDKGNKNVTDRFLE